jgi:hypothetical protein
MRPEFGHVHPVAEDTRETEHRLRACSLEAALDAAIARAERAEAEVDRLQRMLAGAP